MISIEHLKKVYESVTPLKDVNAEIDSGDVISVIGPSGTGKSTLLRCINMLEKPTSGRVLIDGQDMTSRKTDILKIRQRVGMVFQGFNLFSHKMVVENVMMGQIDLLKRSKQEAFEEALRYLRLVGLGERLYSYPDELSGGQKQRVAIARCLAMSPEIVLFDEPTSALDPTMVGEVQSVIHNLAAQGLTMMIVTHDMGFSKEVANRVFYMDDGVIYEDGSPEQIFDNPQGEKTRAFVKGLKTWKFDISSADFDSFRMNSEIEEFGHRYYLSMKQIHTTQLIIEELIANQIIKSTTDINIRVGYFEKDGITDITLCYGGKQFNPYDTEDEDVLSMLLARQLTENVRYEYGERNILTVELKI